MKRRQRGAPALNRSEPFCARRLRKGKARISLRTLLLLSSFVFLCLERHRRHCDAPRLRRAKFDALRAALGGGEKASLASPESFSKLKKRFLREELERLEGLFAFRECLSVKLKLQCFHLSDARAPRAT